MAKAVTLYKTPRLSEPKKSTARNLDKLEAELLKKDHVKHGDISIVTGEHKKHGYVVIVRDDRRGHWVSKPIKRTKLPLAGRNLD